MKCKMFSIVTIFVVGTLLCCWASAAENVVKMVGSSTVFKKIIQPSMKGITKEGITIEENIKGTGPGFIALEKGEADVLLASAELPEVIKAAKDAGWRPDPGFDASVFREIKIYEDEILVVANHANKVKKLSKEQLKGIFSGTIRNWKDVGGADIPIVLVIPEKGRATREVFQERIMDGVPLSATCLDATPTAKVDDIIRANESAIGFTSKAFFYRGKLRIIDTVKLSRPLLLITKGIPSPAVDKLENFLTGIGRMYWEDQDLMLFWTTFD